MLNLLIGLSLPNLAAVTKPAFKVLNTLAIALRQANTEVPLAATQSYNVRVLKQASLVGLR